jgi:hypothetical protein
MNHIPKFHKYACVGDSIAWTVEGFDIVASIEHDYDTRPTDFDCYDAEQVKAWEFDQWFFCGVVLSVSRNGVDLSDHAASLWGVECNLGTDNDYLTEVCAEMEAEALAVARAEVVRIREALEG